MQPFLRARGFGHAVRALGVQVHEGSPVWRWKETSGGVRLDSERGSLTAGKVVFATNAYTSLLGLEGDPVQATYSYVLATEPLDPSTLAEIGWSGHHTMLVDAGPLADHYYLRVAEGRFMIGGGGRPEQRVRSLPPHHVPEATERLRREMVRRLPCLEGASVEYAWGGPLGMTDSRFPVMAQISPRCYLDAGFNGRGALLAALSGKIMLGLLLGEDRADPDYMRFGRLLFGTGGRAAAPAASRA